VLDLEKDPFKVILASEFCSVFTCKDLALDFVIDFIIIVFVIIIISHLLRLSRDRLASLLNSILLLVLQALINLLQDLVFDLAGQPEFLGGLTDGARWKVEVDLVNDLTQMSFHVGNDDRLG